MKGYVRRTLRLCGVHRLNGTPTKYTTRFLNQKVHDSRLQRFYLRYFRLPIRDIVFGVLRLQNVLVVMWAIIPFGSRTRLFHTFTYLFRFRIHLLSFSRCRCNGCAVFRGRGATGDTSNSLKIGIPGPGGAITLFYPNKFLHTVVVRRTIVFLFRNLSRIMNVFIVQHKGPGLLSRPRRHSQRRVGLYVPSNVRVLRDKVANHNEGDTSITSNVYGTRVGTPYDYGNFRFPTRTVTSNFRISTIPMTTRANPRGHLQRVVTSIRPRLTPRLFLGILHGPRISPKVHRRFPRYLSAFALGQYGSLTVSRTGYYVQIGVMAVHFLIEYGLGRKVRRVLYARLYNSRLFTIRAIR